MLTKCGITIPDENDKYHGYSEAIVMLYKVCRQICVVLDRQQDEIDRMKRCLNGAEDKGADARGVQGVLHI